MALLGLRATYFAALQATQTIVLNWLKRHALVGSGF
jgi:hypothetical protein